MSLPAIIQCRKLSKCFGVKQTQLLPTISLCVETSSMIAIMGPSGCGKTTLLNILGLIDNPSDGAYYLQTHNTTALSQKQREQLRRQTFGHIFQQYHLIDHLTILDNILLPLRYRQDLPYCKQEGIALLARFDLADLASRYPNELSGGQAQRVSIARALVTKPAVILADEPTGALDTDNTANVLSMLQTIHQSFATTIIMVTHDLAVAKSCEKMYRFEDLQVA